MIEDAYSRCPSEETLGAFLDGRLSGSERDAVVMHIATCDRCIAGAAFVTQVREESRTTGSQPVAREPRSRRFNWLSIAAALVIVAGIAAFVMRSRAQPGIPTLIAAAPTTYRTIEPRLTGFPWAELQRLRADVPPDPDALRLGGAAAEVLVRAQRDASDDAVHAAGVAKLLLQRANEAVEQLRAVAAKSGTAAAWNDLAAAYYTSAVRDGRNANLPRALAAADRAIAVDESLHEARFNRALILERMGLRNAALDAWREYLTRDPSSSWAAEAKRHADALPQTPATPTRSQLERLEQTAIAGNGSAIETMVRAAPQDARAWFETDVLGRWGAAATGGDDATAATLLAATRAVAGSLQRISGESLLADAIHAIDRADGARRIDLANAHSEYRRARLLYRDRRLAEATKVLLDVAEAFDASRSPMGNVARFFAACTLFDENRIDDATSLFASIAPAAGHDALRAQVALRLAACHQYAGRWEEAVRGFTDARNLFLRLHETANAAFAEANLGNSLDELGARDEAWRYRIAAFERYGSGYELIATMAAAVRSELRAEEYASARSLVAIEAAETAALDDPLFLADVWRRHALIDTRSGDDSGAAQSIARCRALLERSPASGLRTRLLFEVNVAEATAIRQRDPRAAIALLESATQFLADADQRIALPDAFLEYGRALRTAGRDADALAAFRNGLDEIEAQRRSAPAGSAIFDAVVPLVEETIALQLAKGDAVGAFATAERVQGGALPATAAQVAAKLPTGTMLIRYALVPDGVAAISVTRDRIEAITQTIARGELAKSIGAFRTSIMSRDALANVQTRAADLDRILMANVPGVRAAKSIVIVPDRFLHAVPWSALYDRDRKAFAIETHALTIAPSAALYLRNASAPASTRAAQVLVVTGASRELDHLAAEASGYDERRTLTGNEATASRFLALAAESDVIHFAGHARLGADPALLLNDTDELRAVEIARARLPRPRLIVLAACGTAAGTGDGFDGPRGLAGAFLTAGAGAVVGTLWPVDDAEAAELFAEFHRRMRNGEDAATALRHATLGLLHGGNARRRHPAAWAAAELFGGNVTIAGT
jgi:CHAT domain-containing protein